MMSVTVFAPAKVNRTLHVGPAQSDGRHPLSSVVAFADIGDEVTIAEGPLALELSGPFAFALGGENLIIRALRELGVSAKVRLEKNLPVASGIGGGSADAAAALVGANCVFGLGLSVGALKEIGARLGADVPACVAGETGFMSGTGEIVRPMALPPLTGVLVNPGIPLSTSAVYRRFDERGGGDNVSGEDPPTWPAPEEAISGLIRGRNDLQAPACDLAQEVGEVLDWLSGAPSVRLARMSGSGATCFALTNTLDSAEQLAHLLTRERPHWWVRATTFGNGRR